MLCTSSEPVLQMVLCLKQHSHDRGLTSKSGHLNGEGYGGTVYENIHKKAHPGYLGSRFPGYWICAYANRHGDLGAELDVLLVETSFVRALKLCKGTDCLCARSRRSYFYYFTRGLVCI